MFSGLTHWYGSFVPPSTKNPLLKHLGMMFRIPWLRYPLSLIDLVVVKLETSHCTELDFISTKNVPPGLPDLITVFLDMYLKISKHWFRDAEGAVSEVLLIVEPEPVALIFSSNWVKSIRDISLLLQICFHSVINLTNLSCGKKISTDSFITPRNLVVWEVPE